MSATTSRRLLLVALRVLVGGALVLFVAVIVARIAGWVRPPVWSPPSLDRPATDRFRWTGVSYQVMDGDRPRFLVEADEISHRKRTMGPLTINPVKEIAMRGVRLELRTKRLLDPGEEDEELLDRTAWELFAQFLSQRNLGMVTRVTADELTLIVERRRAGEWVVEAGLAELDLVRGAATFAERFSIRSPAGQAVMAKEAIWDSETRKLWIAGSFLLLDENGAPRRSAGAWVAFTKRGELVVED